MADGFLGRWSQRKQAVREGRPLAPAPETAPEVTPAAHPLPAPGAGPAPGGRGPVAAGSTDTTTNPPTPPSPHQPHPTLADVAALSPNDSFARFVRPDVPAAVSRAALKKLFSDPHYNLMDGLDIYIDDYSLPSPLSAALRAQMTSTQFLNLSGAPPEASQDARPVTQTDLAGDALSDAPVDARSEDALTDVLPATQCAGSASAHPVLPPIPRG